MPKVTKQELWDATQKYGSVRKAGRELGVPESTIRNRLKGFIPDLPKNCYVPDQSSIAKSHVDEEGFYTEDLWEEGKAKRFIFTAAQNNAKVHVEFFKNLKVYAKEMDAEIRVGFTVYDKTGYRGLVLDGSKKKQTGVWWDKAVQPFACNHRVKLHPRLAFCGELDILASARRPLSTLDSYCGRSSVIVAHNKLAHKLVPSPMDKMPKELHTTMSCTLPRFVARKAGQVAHFHHALGAIMVTVAADGYWTIDQICATKDGSFQVMTRKVKNQRITKGKIEALILPDIHHEKLDEVQADIAYDLIEMLKPKNIVIHDLIDFKSRNHHNRENPFFLLHQEGIKVQDEIRDAGIFLDGISTILPHAKTYVVRSNHDEAFDKWLTEADWKKDPINAEFYLESALQKVRHGGMALEWAIKEKFGLCKDVDFLAVDQLLTVKDIVLDVHGHIGPSGSMGSPIALSRLGYKLVTMHTHSSSIIDGCWTGGIMGRLDQGYNRGFSKWCHTYVVIYENGKRGMVQIKNERIAA